MGFKLELLTNIIKKRVKRTLFFTSIIIIIITVHLGSEICNRFFLLLYLYKIIHLYKRLHLIITYYKDIYH